MADEPWGQGSDGGRWREDYYRRDYRSRFFRWAEHVEKFLVRTVIIALVLLMLGQTVLHTDLNNVFLRYADRMGGSEGQKEAQKALSGLSTATGAVSLVVMNRSSSKVAVLVNGDEVGTLEKGRVGIVVADGDEIALDGTRARAKAVVRVVFTSRNVFHPLEGKEYVVTEDVVKLGEAWIR